MKEQHTTTPTVMTPTTTRTRTMMRQVSIRRKDPVAAENVRYLPCDDELYYAPKLKTYHKSWEEFDVYLTKYRRIITQW
ncbi:hypothetical protein JG688_00002532 [Phytophthora aleatoria]|uniref:Uncharacterized protein n=1 Tax=Phytophthora aleatoria TaxID=2496075 RepID=A0A8J5IV66_9STRA|nr:hypothetical protein JG688_00002532 [Phytophthora aleatoria]